MVVLEDCNNLHPKTNLDNDKIHVFIESSLAKVPNDISHTIKKNIKHYYQKIGHKFAYEQLINILIKTLAHLTE